MSYLRAYLLKKLYWPAEEAAQYTTSQLWRMHLRMEREKETWLR
jgi:hypothetical protein